MLIPKVKICGITNLEDASAAVDLGADLLGFNFYPKSPRYITQEKATKIISKLSCYTDIVGIFVNTSFEQICDFIAKSPLDWVQLHGDENTKFCSLFLSLNVKTIKALRIKERIDIKTAENFFTDAILLDAFQSEKYGGTGINFNWNIIGHIEKRVFLAGGINPDNISAAVELGVYGIDVCSGIESEPGRKDHKKMKKLFQTIRHLRG